ncbi:hypothetical protein QFC21_002179 [Naganishia friedmannii]|uniref:Uncharacterized protein n=1 Tax=Naganishia friedmannii TaxID=89922 RepID=A0ACC2W1D7_9TREE|nr:hypothetical protein QFC21_002179 [Naganishia friedmannii]
MSNDNDQADTPSVSSFPSLPSSPGTSTPGTPSIPTIIPGPEQSDVLVTTYDDLFAEYSPSRPKYVFDGDWTDFCDFDLYADDVPIAHSKPIANCFNTNVAQQGHEEAPPSPVLDVDHFDAAPSPIAADAFLTSQDFMDWYIQSMRSGAFDAVDYSNVEQAEQGIDPSCLQVSAKDIHPPHEDDNAAAVSAQPLEQRMFLTGAVQAALDNLRAVVDEEARSILAPLVTANRPTTSVSLTIDCSDLNDIPTMVNDDDSDNGSVDHEVPYIEPADVIRHYWNKGDIRYCVLVDGRRQYMSAEEMDDCLGGVNYALWHYWKAKRAGRIPYDRIVEYLIRMGHEGFLREMVYHLAPAWLRRLLYAARKNGCLKSFVIPQQPPKKK